MNLELGGKAPAIVLASADLDLAAKAIWDSRVINTGQVCNCAEVVLVEDAVHDELVAKLKELFDATRYGDTSEIEELDEALEIANASRFGLTSSVYTDDLNQALKAVEGLQYGETYVNRENFEVMQGFHAGRRESGIGGADGKHGLLEFTETHVAYIQRN